MKVNANLPNPPAAGPAPQDHDALPAGTRFGEFEIIRVLGVGGFGIVYLAHDHSLERQVALKEYMPAALAARGAGAMIAVRAGSFAETFGAGLRSFINEARLLARFDHPSLVKVYRFWEDNGTAYMVMPYLQGRTLRDARRAMGHPPDEAWIRAVLDPLLDALEQLHREGVFHRDIAPDNILLPPAALPILLDFGAARRVIADRTQSLTAIVKPNYAPIEQYAEMAAMPQGPWTDLYALGAVLNYLLFGVPPAPATARAVQPEMDRNEPIDQRVVPGVSPRFLGIVRWMLGVRPLERPQSVAHLRAALNGQSPIPADTGFAVTAPSVAVTSSAPAASAWAAPAAATLAAPAAPAAAPVRSETLPSDTPATHLATTIPGSAPLRSTPPGTLPPAYVPPPRPAAAAPADSRADAVEPTAVAKPPMSPVPPADSKPIKPPKPHRHLVAAGALAAAAIAAGVLWQFVDVISGQRAVARVTDVLPTASATVIPLPAEPEPAARNAAEAQVATAAPVVAAAASPSAASRPSARPAVVLRNAPAGLRDRVGRVERGPTSARQACGDRNFLSRAVCMDRECERPRFRASAECVKVLGFKRRRAVEH